MKRPAIDKHYRHMIRYHNALHVFYAIVFGALFHGIRE